MSLQSEVFMRQATRMLVVALLGIGLVQPAVAQDCALEKPLDRQRTTTLPNNKLFPIDVGGDPLNILFHWDDLPATDTNPADGIPDMVQNLVDQIDTALDRFDDAGFRNIPGVSKCDTDNVYTVYVYQTEMCSSPGGPIECAAGGTGTATAFDFRFSSGTKANGQIALAAQNTIAHEVFHSIQLNHPLSDPQKWLIEGTATLMPDLVDPVLDGTRNDAPPALPGGGDPCEVVYLKTPELNLVRRFNELFKDNSNVCSTKLYWRYYTEQVGRTRTEPTLGIDALVDLLNLISDKPSGWRINADDRVIGAGDFDGDGREEFLVQSSTHIGLIASTFGQNRILNVTAAGARLGQNGWLLSSDDTLSFIGDFNGDGKDEFLITSRTHVGFVGLDRNNRFRTLDSVQFGAGRFGDGWLARRKDRVLGIADVDGDGADDVFLNSRQYVGVVGLTPQNDTRTVAVRARRGLDRDTVRVLANSAQVGGAGDLNGDGREEFVLTDKQGLYALRVTATGQFEAFASLDWREQIPTPAGGDWEATRLSEIRGVADLAINGFSGRGRDEVVIQNPNDFAILGFDELAGFYVRSNYSFGLPFGNGSAYSRSLEIIAVDNMDAAPDAEFVIRQANELGILDVDPVSLALTQVGTRQHDDFRNGELSVARFNGDGAYIINRTSKSWRTMAYYPVPGLIEESNLQVGNYVDDLISRMDQLIRARTAGARDFQSLWRDFSIALYVKNLNVRSLTSTDYFVDEQNDRFKYHRLNTNAGPPVANKFIDPFTEHSKDYVDNNRWSSRYFRVFRSNNAGQSVLVNVVPERGQGRMSVTVVIIEGDQLVRMERDVNPRGAALLKKYELSPGQELGVIISLADAAPDYSVRIISD